MSLTDLMPSTKDQLIAGLKEHVTAATTLLARGVSERDGDEAAPGTPLWDSRVFLGRDGRTGARDIRSEGGEGGSQRPRCEDPTCWDDDPDCVERAGADRG